MVGLDEGNKVGILDGVTNGVLVGGLGENEERFSGGELVRFAEMASFFRNSTMVRVQRCMC